MLRNFYQRLNFSKVRKPLTLFGFRFGVRLRIYNYKRYFFFIFFILNYINWTRLLLNSGSIFSFWLTLIKLYFHFILILSSRFTWISSLIPTDHQFCCWILWETFLRTWSWINSSFTIPHSIRSSFLLFWLLALRVQLFSRQSFQHQFQSLLLASLKLLKFIFQFVII